MAIRYLVLKSSENSKIINRKTFYDWCPNFFSNFFRGSFLKDGQKAKSGQKATSKEIISTKGIWNEGYDKVKLKELINDAMKNGQIVNEGAITSITYVFGTSIGWELQKDANGIWHKIELSKIQLWFDESGYLRSAFPIFKVPQ